MGFTEVLTIIFVVCKLVGVINWCWVLVLLPEIIAFVFYIAMIVLQILGIRHVSKKSKKMFDDFDF